MWKRCDADRYLHRATNGKWCLSRAKYMNAQKNTSSAHSESMKPGLLPMDACKWQVKIADSGQKWEEQPLKVHSSQAFAARLD